MWCESHLRQYAIVYVIACYLTFVLFDQLFFKLLIDVPGIALIVIGCFWLGVMKLLEYVKSKMISVEYYVKIKE